MDNSECSSGGYIQSANWFPLNQCMWFEYYGYYVKFSSCDTLTSSVSYDGIYASVSRTTYSNSACTDNPSTDTFSDDCTVPASGEPVLIESYLTQCSSQCASSTTTTIASSSDCNNGQINSILGLSAVMFIMMIVMLGIKLYELFAKKPAYDADKSTMLSRL